MGLFTKFKDKITGASSRLNGRTDALEAVCAAAALIAAADGDIADDEVASTLNVIANNETLSNAFDVRTIEQTADKMLKRAKGGFSGQAGLWKEIEDVAKDKAVAEDVLLIALDVAHADGEVGEKEQKVLTKLSAKLGLNLSNYTG